MLTVGCRFPIFSLRACVSRDLTRAFQTISQESFPNKWAIYFFWPNDFTPICASEVMALGQLVNSFAERDAVVLGGSTDSEFVHFAWFSAWSHVPDHPGTDIKFPLLSDVRRDLMQSLGIINIRTGTAQRASFVVDPGGTIRFAASVDYSVGRDPNEILRVLDALQTDALCPSSWVRGDPTIHDSGAFLQQITAPCEKY